MLTEPSKTEPKSVDSWNQFFQKLRGLLLQAYNRHLNKYEENMRTLREKRNEPGWSYFDYFAVQVTFFFNQFFDRYFIFLVYVCRKIHLHFYRLI